MTTTKAIAAVCLVSLAFAGSASAAQRQFKPANTAFTATGSITVTSDSGSVPCNAVLSGTTVGGGSITGATLTGCSLTASDFPWKMTSFSATGVNFDHVTFTGSPVGVCGPGRVKGILGKGGKITIAGAADGSCSVSSTLVTSPAISIAN
jgi:uncharacterized protein YjbI with pentapeptide repeats